MEKPFLLIIGLFLGICFTSIAQSSNIGTPFISNFLKKDYKGSPQNWDIDQDKRGVLYFANNDGLLEFDGINWKCYKVSNQTIVRSLKVAPDGKVFVGAQGEMGYFEGNKNGILTYHSLNHLLPSEAQHFADIWNIEIIADSIFFSSGNTIFLYQNNKFEAIYTAQKSLNHLAKIGNVLFVNDEEKGLLTYDEGAFQPFLKQAFFTNKELSGLFSFGKDTLLVSTVKDGLFLATHSKVIPWKINDNDVLKNSQIYCSAKIDSTTFVVGTPTKGLFLLDKSGRILRNINRTVGLQVNNVLCLFTDSTKNLWAGLDNGIDFIETNSPFTNIFPDRDLMSMGYAIQIHKGQIYFGTANGVYSNQWKGYYNPILSSAYQKVVNSDGQVWNLSILAGDLLLNHHEGTYVIENNSASKIPSKPGAWLQIPVGSNQFLSGHYNGLFLLEKEKEWQLTADFQNDWRASCRFIVPDEKGNIWVSHPYRGLFKLQFNTDFSRLIKVDSYNSKQGFPSDLRINVFKIGAAPVFCAERGVYAYNEKTDRFEPDEKWNKLFGKNTEVKRLVEGPNGDIWYVTSEEVGVLQVNDKGIYKNVIKQPLPQLKDKLVNNFETIYPYDAENVFFAHESGFIHYNPQKANMDTTIHALIRQVELINNDSIIYGGSVFSDHPLLSIPYVHNSLRFTFSATHFANSEYNQFQYFLEGQETKWSSWSAKSQVEYTNLKAGEYNFQVRATNIHGNTSSITTYAFEIQAPWYSSTLALIIYGLLILGILLASILIPRQQFEREKAVLQSKQKKKLLQKEKEHQLIEQKSQQEITQLEKEKFQLQIQSKNQELASNTMHLVQKSEMLRKIKEDIQKIAKAVTDTPLKKQLEKITRNITTDERLDGDWEQFAKHFDQVHSQFLQKISTQYPQLTVKDHRLCAYLKMNLSSKEMASLMNISVRSVEVARYRLRKKLALGSEVNLVEFMLQV